MKIHEYQAKTLFRKYRIPVPDGSATSNPDEAKEIAKELGGYPVVVKAQIHAGGRGKGGGVKLAHSDEDVSRIAREMIGMTLVTHQTGPEGQRVKKILVEKGVEIAKELYLSIIPDRSTAKVVIMASEAGGVDIENVAQLSPDKLIKVYVNPLLGLQAFHCREIGIGLSLNAPARRLLPELLGKLYDLFIDYDCSLVEINPLIITGDEKLIALDAKMVFDSNALFRHQDVMAFRDLDEEDPLEVEASKYHLNYINLSGKGNIGNMVNGAGLAMATMDLIKLAGAEPANFLDVGGGASADMVENGFRLILSDNRVKGIFLNIFGGILRCDTLAEGIVHAAGKAGISVPVVVRMEGTNVDMGRKILSESGLNLITAVDLKDAAQKIAQIALRESRTN